MQRAANTKNNAANAVSTVQQSTLYRGRSLVI